MSESGDTCRRGFKHCCQSRELRRCHFNQCCVGAVWQSHNLYTRGGGTWALGVLLLLRCVGLVCGFG